MAKKKPSKKQQIQDELENYRNADDVLASLPEARMPKIYRNLSNEKKEEFVKQLKHLLHEFMDSYMLVGFSVDGIETIIVENHGTPIETRGLNHLAFDFFNQYFSDEETIIINPEDL